jgi:hypothetical protein
MEQGVIRTRSYVKLVFKRYFVYIFGFILFIYNINEIK